VAKLTFPTKYEILVPIRESSGRRRQAERWAPRTLYGQLVRILVARLRPIGSQTHESNLLLAEIAPCQSEQDNYGFTQYSRLLVSRLVDITAIRSVVGRIMDRQNWVIVERKGGIDHAQYIASTTGSEDTEGSPPMF
jgi:hypothetical protein